MGTELCLAWGLFLTWVGNAGCFTGVFREHGCLVASVEMHPIIPLYGEAGWLLHSFACYDV